MTRPRQPNRMMLIGAAVFICIGALMIFEGVAHTISGQPIPATSWTQETTGPEQLFLGVVGVGLGLVAIRLAYRAPPPE